MLTSLGLFISIVGCAGSRAGEDVTKPEITLAQLPGTSLAMQYRGELSIPFAMEIRNRSDDMIKVESVELWTIGDGPYLLQGSEVRLGVEIAAGATAIVRFSMPGFSHGGGGAPTHPVTIRGSAFFDGPEGRFRTVFTRQVRQPSQTGRE
ncbi:MAG: hypothetical protein KY432_01915 [Acidobacteria bacterium]|nr:hypothetical protein [Acidobacteriota bacterium]